MQLSGFEMFRCLFFLCVQYILVVGFYRSSATERIVQRNLQVLSIRTVRDRLALNSTSVNGQISLHNGALASMMIDVPIHEIIKIILPQLFPTLYIHA